MDRVDALAEGCHLLDELLFEDLLEPDPARTDWSYGEARLALVQSTIRNRILDPLAEALVEAGEARGQWEQNVAERLGRAAAAHFAAGQASEGDRLLSRAAGLASPGPLRDELEAGRREPAGFTGLKHAAWLHRRGRGRQAGQVLKALRKQTLEPALREAARRREDGPRPLQSAPALFRVNGIGVGLYGRRDEHPDGSYVATHCFSVLWIPLVPLGAYRVSDAGQGSYYFHARESLSRAARIWRGVAGGAAVVLVAAAGVQIYLGSSWHLARAGHAEARRLERSGRTAEAMARHIAVATQYSDTATARESALDVARLAAASVKEPCHPDDVAAVARVAAAFAQLPTAVRTGAPAAHFTERLTKCGAQIGADSPAALSAAVAVLDLAARTAEGPGATGVEKQRTLLRQKLAEALVRAQRPVDALAHFAALGSPAAVTAARDVVASLGDDDALWVEAAPHVEWWLRQASKAPELAAPAAAFKTRLDGAVASAAATAAVVDKDDGRALQAALARAPRDQDLVRARAAASRAAGDAQDCVARLRALGPGGRLTADGQQLLGACLADSGDIEQADGVLTALVDQRMARYQKARRAYAVASDSVEQRLNERASRGDVPAEVGMAAQKAPARERDEVFRAWVAQSMAKDPQLAGLRAEFLRHRAVATASLTLGTVKLRRAAAAAQPERRAHLEAAERAFLAVREDAEGSPTFHLGYGQVLYRLGRTDEGARELDGLLAQQDPELTLDVSEVYRDLGLAERTRTIAEGLYASAADLEWRQRAAMKRSMVASDTDDKELWLKRADPEWTYVKTELLQIAGDRYLREGKLAEADRAYAQVAALNDAHAAHNSGAANNAALALSSRYLASGDAAHLRAAVKRLEAAMRLDPESAIVAGNLADTLSELGMVAVLERWLRMRELLLTSSEATYVLGSLQAGPLRADVLAALGREPSWRRSLEVARQVQVLAPQNLEPYEGQLRWFAWSRDTAGLKALSAKVGAPKRAPQEAAERRAWITGSLDAKGRAAAKATLARSEQRLARVLKGGHAPTLAVAFLLHADKLDTAAYYDPGPEAYAAAAAACRRAMETWGAIAAERDMTHELLGAAAWRAAGVSPALKAALEKDRRTYTMLNVLYRAATGAASAEVLAALRKQPELMEAARRRRALATSSPTVADWVTARLAGDAQREQDARHAFEREDLALSYDIRARLRPDDEDDQADWALFKANRPARTAQQGH